MLEESLRVLATEHHELEESIASHVSSNGSSIYNTPANSYVSLPRPRRFFDAVSDDEFFDAFSQGSLYVSYVFPTIIMSAVMAALETLYIYGLMTS